MKTKLFCLLIMTANVMVAQVSFEPKKVVTETLGYGAKVTSLFYADLDNDNQKDLILTSYNDDSILWYKNVGGDFTYYPFKKITSAFEMPDQIYATDFDNDGDNDLIATSFYANTVVWYKNLGNSTFSEAILITNINTPRGLVLGDIDNDGDDDLLFGSSNHTVLLYQNLGNGTLASGVNLNMSTSNIVTLKLLDLNNDGLLDVVSSDTGGAIKYAKNTGSAVFDSPISVGYDGNYGRTFDFTDINNDGYLDLVSSSGVFDNLVYYLNQSGNSFLQATTINNVAFTDLAQLKIVDMNNDNRSDILLSYDYGRKMGYYRKLPNGNYTGPIMITTNIHLANLLVAEDFNNDGFTDVAAASNDLGDLQTEKLSVFQFQPSQSGYHETVVNFPTLVGIKVSIADINNDGHQDFISASHSLIWNENHGDGTFSSSKMITTPLEDSAEYNFDYEMTDIDGDGDPDFVTITNENFKVYKNLGSGNFELSYIKPIPGVFHQIEVADLNGDNLKDIIISNPETGGIYGMKWLRNTGSGYSDPMLITFSIDSFDADRISVADLDNDGDQDIIVTSKDYHMVQWLENSGSAAFTFHALPVQSERMTSLLTADFDNDGDSDIFTSDEYFSGIFLYKNNNNGTFANPVKILNYPATELYLSDINNDGWKDLLASELNYPASTTKVVYYLNNGSGFGNRQILDDTPLQESGHITAGDLNNDGKADVAIRWYYGELSYYQNSSNLAVIDFEDADNFVFYPVPFLNTINWSDQTGNIAEYAVSVFSESGQKVLEAEKATGSVSLVSLAAGVYFIQLQSESKTVVRKVIKK